ncbi:MAG: hypothetical protein LIP09_07865 [Bacteroidales bacterium]|nr:hypothetical protein [Bacteroidales bacterium]
MSKDKIFLALVTVGMLLIAAAIVIPIFAGIANPVYRWLYVGGAVALLVGRIFSQYKGSNMRLKRLYRIEMWSAIFFCVAAFFLFYPPGNNLRDVLAFTLAGGAIQIYTSIMIPRQKNDK